MADIDPTHPNYPIEEQDGHRRHTWSPRADFLEQDDEYVVHMEVPGVTKDDMRLELHNDVLHVYGVRGEGFDREHRLTCQECPRGPFSRRIPLPSNVDREAINASFQEGILTVLLPKVSESESRRVQVS